MKCNTQCGFIPLTAAPSVRKYFLKQPSLVNRKTLCFSIKSRQLSARIEQKKYLIEAGKQNKTNYIYHPLYSPNLASSDFRLFFLYKLPRMTKKFLNKIKWKRIWNTSWAQNQLNLTREESTSYLMNDKRRFKIIANIQLIEIKYLLNFSWVNYILLKWKQFITEHTPTHPHTHIYNILFYLE